MSIDRAIEVGEKALAEKTERDEQKRLSSLSEEERTQELAQKEEAEKLEADSALLEKNEEELSEEELARKQEYVVAKEAKAQAEEDRLLKSKLDELTPEEQDQRKEVQSKREVAKEARQAKIQQRIDELSSESKALKAERDADRAKIAELEAKLNQGTSTSESESAEEKRIAKYIEEDESKPYAQRREMNDEALQEWLIEDMVSAQRWIAKQELRRERDRANDTDNTKVEIIVAKQKESRNRVDIRHPELRQSSEKIAALQSEGKTQEEIQAVIYKEYPKAKVIADILIENKVNYAVLENGPELLVQEMEKRMSKSATPPKSDKQETQEERDQRVAREAVEREAKRQSSIPDHLRSSTGPQSEKEMNDLEKAQWGVYKKAFPKKTFEDWKALQSRMKSRTS